MTVLSSSVDSDLIRAVGACIGGDLDVLTTVSEARYRRLSSRGPLARAWLRILSSVAHPARLAARLLASPRGSTFIVTTNPFFAPALAGWLGGLRGQRVVHHVFDLYPDALEAAGSIAPGGAVSRLIAASTRSAQRLCRASVYLGEGLRRHAETRYGAARRSAVIAVAADETLFPPRAAASVGALGLHYGGQLGMMHDADSIVEAVRDLHAERRAGAVRFDFRVGGARAPRLLALAGEEGVGAGPVLPPKEWRTHVSSLHVGLVTLTTEGARVCLPSKTYALMASGLAVIAVCPGSSDLAELIGRTGAGWVVDNGAASGARRDPAAVGREIAALVRSICQDRPGLQRRAEAAARAARSDLGRERIASQWRRLLSEIP